MLFKNMTRTNLFAWACFIAAKILAYIGIVLGFSPGPARFVGGILLMSGFTLMLASIALALYQTRKDRKVFLEEDAAYARVRNLAQREGELKQSCEDLELRRRSIENFIIRTTSAVTRFG